MLYVSKFGTKRDTIDVIKLLSNPPDNKQAIGLSVVSITRFFTALVK